jgi:hypothetical protein
MRENQVLALRNNRFDKKRRAETNFQERDLTTWRTSLPATASRVSAVLRELPSNPRAAINALYNKHPNVIAYYKAIYPDLDEDALWYAIQNSLPEQPKCVSCGKIPRFYGPKRGFSSSCSVICNVEHERKTGKMLDRVAAIRATNKNRLRKNSLDDPTKTEYENRVEQGWNRIWDCGSIKLEWTNMD